MIMDNASSVFSRFCLVGLRSACLYRCNKGKVVLLIYININEALRMKRYFSRPSKGKNSEKKSLRHYTDKKSQRAVSFERKAGYRSFRLTTKLQTTRQIFSLPSLPHKRSPRVFGDFFLLIARKLFPPDSTFAHPGNCLLRRLKRNQMSDVVKTTRRRGCIYITYLSLSAGISVSGKGASLKNT